MPRSRKPSNDRGIKRGDGTIIERPGPNGQTVYQCRWFDLATDGITVRRRARTFPTRDDAEDHLRTMARSKRDGRYVPPSALTVRDVVAAWLEHGTGRWKTATLATYRQRAETHVYPALGALKVEALTTARVQHWVDQLRRAGLAAHMIDSTARVLTGALREATQLGIIPHNPGIGIRKPSTRMTTPPPTWSADEVRAVLRVIRDDRFWSALYRVALASGMRPGELQGLQWKDFDEARALLHIRRTVTKDEGGHVVLGTTTKTGRSRTVALPASCVMVLTRWRTEQKRRRLAAEAWRDLDLIFDRGDGNLLPHTNWQHHHERIIRQAGVRPISLHGLRHTHATLELEAGTHIKIVADRLGHASIQTTLDRYSHVSADLQRAAADALDARLFADDDDATSCCTRVSVTSETIIQ